MPSYYKYAVNYIYICICIFFIIEWIKNKTQNASIYFWSLIQLLQCLFHKKIPLFNTHVIWSDDQREYNHRKTSGAF